MQKDSDSTWMTTPPSPADNVTAVFAVLQQNWPVQYKRDVDESDPAGVWKSNVGYIKQNQLAVGLVALRKMDDKFMPNAPACAKIVREANVAKRLHEQTQPQEEAEPFYRHAAILWMLYSMKMMLHRKQNITGGMAMAALAEANRIVPRYRQAWAEENQGSEAFDTLAADLGGQLIPAWNKVCSIGLQIETVEDLKAIGNSR